jgi:hypothetical protein
MRLEFDVAISVDKLLEQEVTIFGKNVLIIPNVDSLSVKKLVPYHQVLITFSSNTPGLNLLKPESAKDEIHNLYSYFEKFGKVVDMNLEYMPSCLMITYTRHDTVISLLEKSKWLFYDYCRNNNLH